MAKIKILAAPASSIEKQGQSYPYDNSRPNYSGSLEELPKISTKIKPIDRNEANSEIEKGELVLDTQTGALHKALGKPHSQGGTPVNLPDNSFIFSNYKNLALNKKEKKLFEFKAGGNKMKNNTPSKILEKEIDLKHHNKMVDVLQNDKKYDALTTNAAKLMIMKNLEKAGQVAFLQESKKNDAIPDFAKNTAPIYSKDTDQKITQSMQYMQLGGRKLTEAEKLLAQRNKLADVNGWHYYDKDGTKNYYKKYTPYDGPKMNNQQWLQFLQNESPAHKAQRQTNAAAQYGYTEPLVRIQQPAAEPYVPSTPNIGTLQPKIPFNIVGNAPANPNGVIDPQTYDSQLTPWQKLNMLIPFYRAATVKTQYPLRQHQENVIPQFDNQNVQPMLDQNNQGYFNAAQLTRIMNPTQGSSYIQQLYGNKINANNQAISQVQNNNIQTQNRQKEMAAQSLNQDAAQNRAFDARFYDQTQTAIKNRDELKQAYEQQGINNINDTMSKKLAFDSWLNTQQQYKGKPTYIDKDGVQHYQGQALYSPKAGFFGNSVQYNPTSIDWSTYQSTNNSKEDNFKAQAEAIRETFPNATDADIMKMIYNNGRNKAFSAYTSTLPQQKMGGKFRPLKKNKLY